MEKISLDSQNAKHIQAYLDYINIAGYPQENEKLMNEQEFEQMKQQMKENAHLRLHPSWRNSKGVDCKMIGPATKCFCDHTFKSHNFQNPPNKRLHCKVKGCKCPCYDYIPVHGSQDFRCLCKHSYIDHDPISKKCMKGNCGGCKNKFGSTWACMCGQTYGQHATVFETQSERQQQGRDSGTPSYNSILDTEEKNQYYQANTLQQNNQVGSKNTKLNQLNYNLKQVEKLGPNPGINQIEQQVQEQKQQQQQKQQNNKLMNSKQDQQQQQCKEGSHQIQYLKSKNQQSEQNTLQSGKQLQKLNSNIAYAQKINKFEHNSEINETQKKQLPYMKDGQTALDLYNTPHLYGSTFTMSIK